jgi:hypothetical protein
MNDPLVDEILAEIEQGAATPWREAIETPNHRQGAAGAYAQPDPRFFVLRTFLRTVLPNEGPIYFAVTLPTSKHLSAAPRHYASRSIDELTGRLLSLDDEGHETYFATAAYRQARFTDQSGKTKQRSGDNVQAVRACWLDIDVGEDKAASGGGYATQGEARTALAQFCTKLGIPPSLEVSSGRGLHVYFSFKEPATPVEWKRAAKALKYACTLMGLRADSSRTEDIASILRPVECTHRKDPANPRRVEPLSTNDCVEFADLLGALEELGGALRSSRGHVGSSAAAPFTLQGSAPTPAPASNSDLVGGLYEPVRWLRGLSPDDQLRVLDEACSAMPDAEWSRYETWQAILAGFRGLRELDESKLLAILQRHSERSSKWAADGWDAARLREKVRSFNGGSPRHIFELAEACGWNPARSSVLRPFEDITTAEDYFVGRFIFVMDQGGYLDTKSRQLIAAASLEESQAWLTKHLATTPRRLLRGSARARRADSMGYNPGAGALYDENSRTVANLYVPWTPAAVHLTAEEQQIWDWFIDDHLFRRPDDKEARDYFLNALAYPLQAPGRRVASVPLLIGEQYGTGKSTLMDVVPRLVYGDRNVTVATQAEIESSFNDWQANAQIVCFPEIWMGGRDAKKIANDLKDKITSDVLRVHPKGLKGYSQRNRATLLGTSNYEDAVHLREGDRRWGVHITDAPRMTSQQSAALYGFLNSERAPGVLRHILMSRDLSGFNPASEPPMTAGKRRVIAASRSPIEAEIVDLFDSREPPFDRDLFVLECLRSALQGRVPGVADISFRKLAEYVYGKPIAAVRLPGRRRIKARLPVGPPGTASFLRLDGKHGVWCLRNHAQWEAASDKDIARHLEDGSPALTAVSAEATDGPVSHDVLGGADGDASNGAASAEAAQSE